MMCSRSQAFTNRAQGSCPAPGHAVPNSPSRPCSRKTVAARVWQQTQPSVAQQHQTPALNLLDAAMGAMLAMLDGGAAPAKNNPSDELQLPPELRAYLEELEARHGAGHHGGGWVHSPIAERLAGGSPCSNASGADL